MCYGVSTCLLTSSITYYCAYVLNNSSLATPIMAAYLAASIVFSIITPRIDSLLGRKKAMGLAAILQVVGKIPFILAPKSIINAFINAVFTGMGLTMTFVLFNTNRNAISDIVEVQNGRRMDAMVSTGDTLVSKIAEAAVDKLFLVALAAAGFSAKLADEGLLQNIATQNTINALLGWIPALVGILMFVCCIGIDTDKELREAIAEKGGYR